MVAEVFTSIEAVCERIKTDLDTPKVNNGDTLKKVSLLYASNASGKTRLSKLFHDQNEDEVLYYSAFTEDLFSWDNTQLELKIDPNAKIFTIIHEQGLYNKITDRFQKITGSKLEPAISLTEGMVLFETPVDGNGNHQSIKISRGEESVFIWAVFCAILEAAIDELNIENEIDRSTPDFNAIEYILIDDPVSSMDDSRIITIALELIGLIKKSKSNLKFFITTHHALFFNVLFNSKIEDSFKKSFIFTKTSSNYLLRTQGTDSPFAYHHIVISEIQNAIKSQDIKKYHLNLFRGLLEKTANFLGYNQWDMCLDDDEKTEAFKKIIQHYSHDSLSELDYNELDEDEKKQFKAAFYFFLNKFKWGKRVNE